MNKSELVSAVSEATKISKKDTELVISATIEAIKGALKEGERVQLVGFGSFETKKRNARKGHNPKTGDEIKIKATKVPAFKAGKALKDAVAK